MKILTYLRAACLTLSLTLFGCYTHENKVTYVHNAIPEAHLPGASDFDFHVANPDAAIFLFEYSAPSHDQAANMAQIRSQFDDTWSTDTLTSSELVVSRIEPNKPFWDINRQVHVHTNPDGKILVLMAGIDSPAEEPLLAKTLKKYTKRKATE